nr:MAG TPA: hypothetical protein [Caudoviricetes sp.]
MVVRFFRTSNFFTILICLIFYLIGLLFVTQN